MQQRLQALIDFQNWTLEKTGEKIGIWLDVQHRLAGTKPSYIGSHTIDGAGNAALSVKHLQSRTAGERSQSIVAHPCSAHRISTSADQGSGTSKHKVNLKQDLAVSLNLLHWWCIKFGNYTAPKTALKNVHKEIGREKFKTIKLRLTCN